MLLGTWHLYSAALTDCSRAPNCTHLHRQPCDPNITTSFWANACGDCLEGSYGSKGPMNSACLSQKSCALIYPSQDSCDIGDAETYKPLVVPVEQCTCDHHGEVWATASDRCALVRATELTGLGRFVLYQCGDSSCDVSSCTELARWSPMRVPYGCKHLGTDAFVLSDDCSAMSSMTLLSSHGKQGVIFLQPSNITYVAVAHTRRITNMGLTALVLFLKLMMFSLRPM